MKSVFRVTALAVAFVFGCTACNNNSNTEEAVVDTVAAVEEIAEELPAEEILVENEQEATESNEVKPVVKKTTKATTVEAPAEVKEVVNEVKAVKGNIQKVKVASEQTMKAAANTVERTKAVANDANQTIKAAGEATKSLKKVPSRDAR